MSRTRLFNATDLAAELNFCAAKVFAMKKLGFKFSHGRRTTKAAALEWLSAEGNVGFSMTQAYPKKKGKSRV